MPHPLALEFIFIDWKWRETKVYVIRCELTQDGGNMTQHPARLWHGEFTDEGLAAVRHAIPLGIQRSQTRSANAHAAYGDKDGDRHVYGAGMSRGVYKELVDLLNEVPGFREVEVEGSRRKLIAIDNVHLYPLRVGAKMPRNHRRVRVSYMPEQRQEMFRRSSTTRFDEPGLFDDLHSFGPDEPANISEALAHQERIDERKALVVAYYSCTPAGVGSIYWAPAKLSGTHYLEFAAPESLTYKVEPENSAALSATKVAASRTFADGIRPRTATKLRMTPKDPDIR